MHLAQLFALLLALCMIPATLQAAPLLRCQVAYAGTIHQIEAAPATDPYAVPSIDIGGRFRFKAVVIGDAARVEYIKLYAYYQTPSQPVLLHAAKYLPPWPTGSAANSLTGQHSLYSPDLGRELQFGCALQGATS
ncbi:MAG: hypothetical protein KGZ83_10675 [Sulfuricella sp.]|nr:hypothetical protein [Sulfuricella sp.]